MVRDRIENRFIGDFLAIPLRTEMFDLDAVPLLDDLVGFRLELHHRREVSVYGVGCPHLSVDDAVEW